MTARPDRKRELLERLQILRGTAAFGVLLFHLIYIERDFLDGRGICRWFNLGSVGVEVFFVLSGFIIHWIHAPDIANPGRAVRYLICRFSRIYPPYWIILAGILAACFLVPEVVSAGKLNWRHVGESILLLPLGSDSGFPILSVAWTLFHEVKFYIFYGLLILLPRKAGRALGLCLLGLTFAFGGTAIAQNRLFYGSPGIDGWLFFFSPYNLLFASGLGIAAFFRKFSQAGACLRWLLPSAAGYFAVLVVIERNWAVPHGMLFVLIGLASVALVGGAVSLDLSKPLRQHRITSLLLLAGSASYSIYLVHQPIYEAGVRVILRVWPTIPVLFAGVVLLGVAVIGGFIFWYFLERTSVRLVGNLLSGNPSANRQPVRRL